VEVLNEIDAQVQRYLWTLLVANVLIALATWGALASSAAQRGHVGRDHRRAARHPVRRRGVATFGIGVAMFLHSGSVASAAIAMAWWRSSQR
jgi:hypothetical protein